MEFTKEQLKDLLHSTRVHLAEAFRTSNFLNETTEEKEMIDKLLNQKKMLEDLLA